MKHIKNLLLVGLMGSALSACDPAEDRESLGEPLSASDLNYSVSQQPGYDNMVYLENQTPQTIPYWDYVIGTSTRDKDTVVFPFGGDYWIKYTAFGKGGSAIDSTKVTVTENDPEYFSDPSYDLLTNGMNGKYWKLVRVTLGPATNHEAIWGDVSWWSADAYNWNDSAYFDLNGGFHFKRFHNGEVTESKFDLNLNEVLTGAVIPDPGRSILINGGNQLPVRDGSNEMAEINKTHYRIYKLSADTLIVGQGAYYTASRTTEDWSYYHWYVPVE
jgi:hypothetical protein